MDNLSIEHYRGCLLGGAIGDALGAPIEFLSIEEIREKYGNDGVTDYVEFLDGIGRFTDDTQMTLFTTDGIIRGIQRVLVKGIGGAMIEIVYESYLRWLITQGVKINLKYRDIKNGWLLKEKGLYSRRAPGKTCLDALSSGNYGKIDKPINNSKGCGAVMRVAPAGLYYAGCPGTSFQLGCEIAAITHGNPTGYLSAGCFASIIANLAQKKNLEQAISGSIEILTQQDNHQECLNAIEKALALSKKKIPDPNNIALLGQGWVAEEALAISIYCALCHQTDFQKGVLSAINHSGDSDSTGAITGNILGLILGENKLPKRWIDHLDLVPVVEQMSTDLYLLREEGYGILTTDWFNKYPG